VVRTMVGVVGFSTHKKKREPDPRRAFYWHKEGDIRLRRTTGSGARTVQIGCVTDDDVAYGVQHPLRLAHLLEAHPGQLHVLGPARNEMHR